MNPGDVKDALDGLPLAKKATPAQMVLLLVSCVALIWCGVKIGGAETAITNSIAAVDAKVDKVAANENWIKASMVTKPEFSAWAYQLDKGNRKIESGAGLFVPDAPAMVAPASAPPTLPSPGSPEN
jgi:hypothetical protein